MPTPPIAKSVPHIDTYHGAQYQDPYHWLRERDNPEVTASLEAENAYCEALMAGTEELQKSLYDEILSHIKETDDSVPYRKGDYFYYSRTEAGQQYPRYCRKKGSTDAPEEVTLDLNEMAVGKPFLSVGAYSISEDGKLLAFSVDETGYRQYQLRIKNLTTGETLPDRAERVGSVAWASDNETLFYTTEDETTKRQDTLFRHKLGQDGSDATIFHEPDERFQIGIGKTRSKAYLMLEIGSHTTTEFRFLPANQTKGEWTTIAPRIADQEYYPDHHGDAFIIRANDTDRNFRLVTAPVASPGRENWTEIVPHSVDTMIEDHDLFARHLVLNVREGGLTKLRVMELDGSNPRDISFPEPTYSAGPDANAEFETDSFRYSYNSLITPRSIYEANLDTLESTLLKQNEVPGGFDRGNYESKRLFATASDGTKIPISVSYRKDVDLANAPVFVRGYGSYGLPYPASFSATNVMLMDHGFVIALAHIRGGGDLGKRWHDAGRLENKMNTFTDFIACSEYLVTEGYGSKEKLVVSGGSAGGLLMGAIANLRPDLFTIILSYVPFVDVINTMMDASLPLTVGEYEEWGNPNEKPAYDTMRAYCPYSNLEAKSYPTILIRTSFNDSQVMYWEPAKYVAKLRTLKTDSNPLLFKTNLNAGHGGSSGRYEAITDSAWDYAFVFKTLGIA